jgi:hypothetical protein
LSVKNLTFFVLLFISLTLVSCSNDPSAIGSSFLAQKGDLILLDSLDSFKDTLPQVSSTFKHIIPLGFSTTLLLGQKGDNIATTLLSFNIVFPDSIKTELINKTLQVTDANVLLYKSSTFGDTASTFDYSAHEITTGWTSSGFTIDSLPQLQYKPEDVIINNSKGHDTLVYEFHMSTNLALQWLNKIANGSTPDNGIILIPSAGSQKIVGFFALSAITNIDLPSINIVVNKPGFYIDTLRFSTTADLSVVSGPIPQNQQNDYIYAQSSVYLESRLYFDISKLPPHAIINYAELQLTIDTTKSLLGSGLASTDLLTARFITDTTNATLIDSLSTSAVTLYKSTSAPMYTGNISLYVQTWLSTKNNKGILIQPFDYTTGTDLWAIYGSKAVDPSNNKPSIYRPRLKITYTNKK